MTCRRGGHGFAPLFILAIVISATAADYHTSLPTVDIEQDRTFTGGESAYRFLRAMRMEDMDGMVRALELGKENEYTGWLLEYGRELLKSCDDGAMIFTGTYIDTIVAWYLQYMEAYRNDVTVVPIGLLDKPWFLMTLKEKEHLITRCLPISWSKEMIFQPDPQAFIRDAFELNVSKKIKKCYELNRKRVPIKLNLSSLYGQKGAYLDRNVAVLIDIIQTNQFERPVYFTLNCNRSWLSRVRKNLRISGLVCELVPQAVSGSGPDIDLEKTEALFVDSDRLQKACQIGAAAGSKADSIKTAYISVGLELIRRYRESGQLKEAEAILNKLVLAFPDFPILHTEGRTIF